MRIAMGPNILPALPYAWKVSFVALLAVCVGMPERRTHASCKPGSPTALYLSAWRARASSGAVARVALDHEVSHAPNG